MRRLLLLFILTEIPQPVQQFRGKMQDWQWKGFLFGFFFQGSSIKRLKTKELIWKQCFAIYRFLTVFFFEMKYVFVPSIRFITVL